MKNPWVCIFSLAFSLCLAATGAQADGEKKPTSLTIVLPEWQTELARRNLSRIIKNYHGKYQVAPPMSLALMFTLDRSGKVTALEGYGSGFNDPKLRIALISSWKEAVLISQPLSYVNPPKYTGESIELMLRIDPSDVSRPFDLIERVPPHFTYIKPKPDAK